MHWENTMKRSTKGALAIGAAAVLLMGGAGTLAYWSDTIDVPGGDITSGELKLENATCASGWEYADGTASAGAAVDLVVPGDVIAKECTFDVVATGTNLNADLVVPATATFTDATSPLTATVSATYVDSLGDPLPAAITEDDDGTVTATIEVEFPYGTAEDATTPVNINDSQGLTKTLNAITVSVEQNDPNP